MPAGGKEPEVPCAQTDRVLLPHAIAGCTGPETGSAEPSAFISPDPAVIATPSLPISYYISQGGRHFLLILLFPGWPRQNQQFHRAYHYCPPISFVSSSGPCFEPDDAPLFLASTMLTACEYSPWNWSRVPSRMDGTPSMMLGPSPLRSLRLLSTHMTRVSSTGIETRPMHLKPSSNHAFLEAGFGRASL